MAEAFPLLVAICGVVLWTVNLSAIGIDKYPARFLSILVLPPAYFFAGAGWFAVSRSRAGWVALLLHDAAAAVTMFYGLFLVFGRGDFAGPGPNAPFREFFFWLAVSLAVSVVSTVWLATWHLRRVRLRVNTAPS
jgi:hypothetical protein